MLKNNQFYILRHGETEYQTKKRHIIYPYKGSLKRIGLTKKGREEVEKSAKKLKKIDYIYSSDFLRTKQTTLIVKKRTGTPKENVFFKKELRDNNLGKYHGKRKKKFYKDVVNFPQNFSQKPEGGESLEEVKERVKNLVLEIDNLYKNKNILIISHGEPLWMLEGVVYKIKKSDLVKHDFYKKNSIKTGELRKLN